MKTLLTERFGLEYPVIQAPMAFAAGGALAAAASRGGALGMIGGGYGDPEWIRTQYDLAGDARVGCGFITWRLSQQPWLLDEVLERKPVAVFLSFGDPAPYAEKILNNDTALVCQVQTLKDARRAVEVGADVIVAQGAEAGGHGEIRGTMALVPEISDEIARLDSNALLVAAGGISDGRGLAAARVLGAEGIVMGTRYWASREALVLPKVHQAAIAATGDETVRTRILDMVRGFEWPERYTARAHFNDFLRQWHGREEVFQDGLEQRREAWEKTQKSGDPANSAIFVGEGLGLIAEIISAEDIARIVSAQASDILAEKGTG
jgi:nitronate monooxygenase